MHARSLLAIIMPLAIVACSSESTNEENTGTSTEALVAGVPQKEWLEIAVAEFDPKGIQAPNTPATTPVNGCTANGKAGLADLSMTVSSRANGMLAGVMEIVTGFTKLPPTATSPNHATWGPFTGTEPKGTFRFDVERRPDGSIAFQLTAQKPGTTDFIGLFHGQTKVVDKDHRAGDVELDLASLHAIDPERNKATAGGVAIHFGNLDGNVAIDMSFANAIGPETPPTDAKYRYMRRADGAGAFEFLAHSTDPNAPAEKLLLVNTAWSAGGAGKSQATEMVSGKPAPSQVVECWTPDAGLVFHKDGAGAVGSPDCCTKAPDGP